MFPVSDAYLAAMRSPVITDKVYGWIKTKSGEVIEVSDEKIQQNSLVITRKTCGSQFDIGTFNAAQMSVTLYDDAAYDREYGGAVIILRYSVLVDKPNNTWEDVPLGTFYVDGQAAVRKSDRVTLKAYDYTLNFDIQPPDLSTVTSLLEAITAIRQTVNIGAAFTDEEFLALPNSDIKPDFTNARIQSCRDVIMWVAQAVGCCAFVDNLGKLALKRYSYAGGSDYVRYIDENERTKIEFTDTRTYLAYLQSYCDGEVKLYEKVSQWTGADAPHIQEGALSLPENPVLFALSAEEQDTVNNNLLSSRAYPTRYIKSDGFVDPAIELLDTLAFRGGTIDIGQIISVCTEIKWRYRGVGTIVCNNFEEYTDTASAADAITVTDEIAEQANITPMRTPPKSQIEKRIDALEQAIREGGGGDTIEQAVIIQQSDITHLLHEYTFIKYISGNKAVYGGPDSSIVVSGCIAQSDDAYETQPKYQNVSFSLAGSASEVPSSVTIQTKLINANRAVNTNSPTGWSTRYRVEVFINGVSKTSLTVLGVGGLSHGLNIKWSYIYPPDHNENYPYGYVRCVVTAYAITVNAEGEEVKDSSNVATYSVGFDSLSEYRAAINLTYEPEYNDEVNENVTVVPNTNTSAAEILEIAYAYTDKALATHETQANSVHQDIYNTIGTLNSSINNNTAAIASNNAQINDINDVENGIYANAVKYTDTTAEQLRAEFGETS